MKKKEALAIVLAFLILGGGALIYLSGEPPGAVEEAMPHKTLSGLTLSYESLDAADPQAHWKIEASYPVIGGIEAQTAQKLNAAISIPVRKEVEDTKADFEKPCAREDVACVHEANISEVAAISGRFSTVSVLESKFIGGSDLAHPYTIYQSAAYSLKDGNSIGLEALFDENSDYLVRLAEYSNKELASMFSEDAAHLEAVVPQKESFKNFLVKDDGLLLQLDEYQIGPRPFGAPQITVPWAVLEDILAMGKEPKTLWITYRNERYGLILGYPSDFIPAELGSSEAYYDSSRSGVVKVEKSPDLFVAVYADSDRKKVGTCYEIDPYSKQNLEKTVVVNGVRFYAREYGDAAMGGARARIFDRRTIKNGTCYQIEGTIRYRESAQFYDYPSAEARAEASRQEGEKNAVLLKEGSDALGKIISSFRFLR